MLTHARRRPSPEFAAAPQQAFQPAIHCFGRIVAIGDDGAQAWNSMATARAR